MSFLDINLWYEDVADAASEYRKQWQLLSQNEKARADSLKNESSRNRFVAVHARLREILGSLVNAVPVQLRIEKTKYGKPYLTDYPDVIFNLSHTANKLAVVSGFNCELGVDIELCKPRANMAGLVERCFAEEELTYWKQLPATLKTQEFHRFWTRKEAFVKAVGRGIALGLKECVINPHNSGELLRIPNGYGKANAWLLEDLELDIPIYGALAVSANQSDDLTKINLIKLNRI